MNGSDRLLAWYDQHGRDLCFRGTHDPYRIWISEIMLQQTRTETVSGYYRRFLSRFPDVKALASSSEEDVLKMWEGLGYYSRARNLHRTAREIWHNRQGCFPDTPEELKTLPGIGDYTAAAIASIAFSKRAPALDGNLMRVFSRLAGVREDIGLPSVRRQLYQIAYDFLPDDRPGDCNQALMDLGATVCIPGTPDCFHCPLADLCNAYRNDDAAMLPIKAAATPPKEITLAVTLVTRRNRVLVTPRTQTLLKGLFVFCLMEGVSSKTAVTHALRKEGLMAEYRETYEKARHVFTHRVWNMQIYHYALKEDALIPSPYRAVTLQELNDLPFPTAMRAALARARLLLE